MGMKFVHFIAFLLIVVVVIVLTVETDDLGSTTSVWSTPKGETSKGFANSLFSPFRTASPIFFDWKLMNFMLKKMVKETKEKEPTLVIPERSKVVETRTYKPVQYEGSLGKLQAGSVTCPRKMIDFHTVHNDDLETDTQKLANRETKRLSQLLLDIEKLYPLVLQVDDIDKRVIILPEEARLPLFENKKEVISKLYNSFIQNAGHFFLQMVAIRKGRNLVTRSIPLFTKEQLAVLMTIIFSHLSIILKRDTTQQMGSVIHDHFANLLSSCNLDTLHLFGERLL